MSRGRDDLAVRDLRAAGLTDRVAGVTRLRAGGRAGVAQLRLQMGAARRGGKLRIGSVFQHEAAVFVQLPQEGQRSEFCRRAKVTNRQYFLPFGRLLYQSPQNIKLKISRCKG